jgi:choloylglycine hydrolase
VQANGWQSVKQAFHLLNLFDLPVGMQYEKGHAPKDMPSATQFTVVSDLKSAKLYYKTMWNSEIRCIELASIDFGKVSFQSHPLDEVKEQAVKIIAIR